MGVEKDGHKSRGTYESQKGPSQKSKWTDSWDLLLA